MTTLLAALLFAAFPGTMSTAWMQPDAFHLTIGMKRADAMQRLERDGWKLKKGKILDSRILEYDETRTVTLGFERGRLGSMRFEFVEFLPRVKEAFEEQKDLLRQLHGEPDRTGANGAIVIYDRTSPKIHLVLSTSHTSEIGRQGLGMLVVRYFEPPA